MGGLLFVYGSWMNKQDVQADQAEYNSAAGTQLAGSDTQEFDFYGNPLIGGDAVAGQFGNDGQFSISVIYSAEYGFSPDEFTVKKGDVVSFNIRSAQGDVALDIPEFDIALEKINSESSDVTVEFTASTTGEFIFSNALSDAQGTIIVE